MTKLFLAAGVAALAITAPAAAERGGKGGDKAQAERGGGKGRSAERGGMREVRIDRRQANVERRQPQRFASIQRQETRERPQKASGFDRRMERSVHAERRQERAARRPDRDIRAARALKRDLRDAPTPRLANRVDRQELRQDRLANRIERQGVVRVSDWSEDNNRWANARGLIDGCPPGLDRKNNGCLPPGQAKKLLGTIIPATYRERVLPLGLRDLYRDTDDYYYRYGDGYVYRVNRDTNLIASLLPLFTGGYMPGQLFPPNYMNSYVPSYYQPFYADTNDAYYRYANGYIYEIDPYTGLIEDVDPAYGYGYGVGQLMPASYSYYNVPYQYRNYYSDTDDYYYRYAPGAIYQVDRDSSLITAVASLLAGDLGVGSRLPLGYDAYNVPLSYRAQYYDTPDAWYRYNDGYIYQVDPTTRLITAVISALV